MSNLTVLKSNSALIEKVEADPLHNNTPTNNFKGAWKHKTIASVQIRNKFRLPDIF